MTDHDEHDGAGEPIDSDDEQAGEPVPAPTPPVPRGPVSYGLKSLPLVGANEGGRKGYVEAMFDHAIAMATSDICDGILDKTPRKVALIVKMCPVVDAKGNLVHIAHEYEVKTSLPTVKSPTYATLPVGESGQMFQPASPHDPRQPGLPFGDKK